MVWDLSSDGTRPHYMARIYSSNIEKCRIYPETISCSYCHTGLPITCKAANEFHIVMQSIEKRVL